MKKTILSILLCTGMPFVALAAEEKTDGVFNAATPLQVKPHGSVTLQDGNHKLFLDQGFTEGLLVPDVNGGYVLIPGQERQPPNPAMLDAQEIKLKVRELAAQLFETWPIENLRGLVALPTTFVSLDNFNQTSPLGRYFAETLMYECNTRGIPVREYRMASSIKIKPQEGEFILSRALSSVKPDANTSAVLVGTYYRDSDALFINARLVRPDGIVLRSGQVILPTKGLADRMSRPPVSQSARAYVAPPPPEPFSSGTLKIRQGNR